MPDYEQLVKTAKQAEEELQRRKKAADEAEKARRRAESRGYKAKTPAIEDSPSEEQEQEKVMLKVGYEDCYGIWFHGRLEEIIRQVEFERFGVKIGNQMHVFINIAPNKIEEGIHELTVYGHACRLYKWMAQGFHRGLVVLTNDARGNASALVYMESGTWSWQLSDEEKQKLPQVP